MQYLFSPITLRTINSKAMLYFKCPMAAFDFSGNIMSTGIRPSFIIFKGICYINDQEIVPHEVQEYKYDNIEVLNRNEFEGFFQVIRGLFSDYLLDHHGPPKNLVTPVFNKVEIRDSNHMADAFAYNLHGLSVDKFCHINNFEKEIIDQLKIPALENALNEAVRIENYEAAAYIRNKVENNGHLIIEYQGWLKIRMKKPLSPE